MGIFYTPGEKKVRPGQYNRYENGGESVNELVGTVATVFKCDWGPLNSVQKVTRNDSLDTIYGNTSTEIIDQVFNGAAGTILGVRIGTGGTKSTATLMDTTATPESAITATLKYEGTRALGFIIRDVLGDATKREFCVTEDSEIIERIRFDVSDDGEVDALIAASADSLYFTTEKVGAYAGTGKLALVASGTFAGGTDPTVTTESYSNGLALLETKSWDCICVDTDDTAVHTILSGFVNRMYLLGRMGFAVVGEPSSVLFVTRLEHAVTYNDYNTVYVGMGYIDADGNTIEGWKAAALIAGLIASTPTTRSITHLVVDGAIEPSETITNTDYQNAIKNGMIAFSVSPKDEVWVDSGITTLTQPSGEDDKGWQKIKRVKTRIEMMNRITNATAPITGQTPGTNDGDATIVQTAQGVLNDMVAESKLASGATIELADPTEIGEGEADPDSVYFVISALDIDSRDKFYMLYKFRYSATA